MIDEIHDGSVDLPRKRSLGPSILVVIVSLCVMKQFADVDGEKTMQIEFKWRVGKQGMDQTLGRNRLKLALFGLVK